MRNRLIRNLTTDRKLRCNELYGAIIFYISLFIPMCLKKI